MLANLSSMLLVDQKINVSAEYNKLEAGDDSLPHGPLYKAMNDTEAYVIKARKRENVLARQTIKCYTT